MRRFLVVCLMVSVAGCHSAPKSAAGPGGPQGMPVQTVAVSVTSVPVTSEYVATIKSRRSATLQPQVDGRLTIIAAHSGQHVRAGQLLMEIDPGHQMAAVESQRATERQKKSTYDYNIIEKERQQKLFDAGITSHDAYDQAQQAYGNSKADYESSIGMRKTQEEQLGYYRIRAPFDGIVGDIPVHVGDYVSAATVVTTVDENKELEAYIYLPTERAADARVGLAVDLLDTNGVLIEKTKISFLSPQVDNQLQGILAKAPVNVPLDKLRTAQLVKARVVWSASSLPVVPFLAVTRLGGQSFVFLAAQKDGMVVARQTPVTLGDAVGNNYAVLKGLKTSDKVIVTNTQFLVDGMPVMPLGK